MPLLYICATRASSWSFTDSPHFPDAQSFCFCRFASNRQASFFWPQLLLLLLQAARRVFGLATYLFICGSRTGPNAEFGDPGTNLFADIGRRQPACATSRHQKVTCQL